MSRLFGPDFITQKYLRRYPNSERARSWAGVMVHIQTENGVWRTGGSGYTHAGKPDAWIVPFEQAVRQIDHYGPEKMGRFLRAETSSHEPNVAGIHLTLSRALGPYGSAYDPIGVPLRAYTYEHQPGNVVAWNIGCAVAALRQHPSAGDPIDVGLYLLKEMHARGLGVFETEPKAAAPATVTQEPTP